MFGKHSKLITVVTAVVMALTIGSATTMAQSLDTNGATLDPGSDSAQDQLIAEAATQAAGEGVKLNRFDFEAALAGPNGQLLFVPVRDHAQLESFAQEGRSQATAGLIFAKKRFTVQGNEYAAGVHVVQLRRPSDAQSLIRGPLPNHDVDIDTGDGDDEVTVIICEEGAKCEEGGGDQNNDDDGDDGGGGTNPVGGPEGVCFSDPFGMDFEFCAS